MRLALAVRIVVPFALGYFLSYIFRTLNAVIAPDLIGDLGLSAGSLGLLTSAYFLTFAAFQLPLGILLDHFGARRVEAILLMFAAAGAALFAVADSLGMLIFARALIGFGVSACLMASFKAYVTWFPKDKLPLVNGIQMAAGGFGAMTATQPVEWMLGITDWRGVFWVLTALTFVAGVLIFTIVPERDGGHAKSSLRDALGGVRHIFTSPLFWAVAPLTVLSQATFLTIQSLWSGPWLADVAGFDRAQVAEQLLWVAIAMVAGFLSWGVIAERLSKLYAIRPMSVAIFGMTGFLIVQLILTVQWTGAVWLTWMAFGFFGSAGILPYAALSQSFPAHLAGRVNTALNLLAFVFAFAGQWAVGGVLDLWDGTATGGYDPAGYMVAFGFMLMLQAAMLGWFTYARRHTAT